MLAPHRLRRGGAGREAVRVLDRGVVDAVGRHVGGGEALAAERPARAVVLAEPHAAAGDAEHDLPAVARIDAKRVDAGRSEEHTSELQSLMRISYAVFCLKKKNNK